MQLKVTWQQSIHRNNNSLLVLIDYFVSFMTDHQRSETDNPKLKI
jgi:hypothetical protein